MNLNKNIQDCFLAFLDLETTGLLADRSYICEVAAFKVYQQKVLDKFSTLVRPHHKVPYAAFCIHQISDQDLIGAPYFESIAPQLIDFLSDSILCAYNVTFDLGFINYQLVKNNQKPLSIPYIDILAMARDALELKSYKLESVAQFFGLTSDIQFHRAESDAYITYLVFSKLIRILSKKQSIQAKELISRYGQK